MANEVTIRVRVDGSAATAEMASLEARTKASASRQKSSWDKLGEGIQSAMGSAFKGVLGLAGGALGAGLSAPLAGAGLAVAGFAALAKPSLDKVQDALTKTGKEGAQAWAALDPAQRGIANSIKQLQGEFSKAATAFEPVVASVAQLGAKVAGDLLPAISKLAPAGAKVIGAFLTPLDKLLSSPLFAQFTDQMASLATQVAPVLGATLTKLLAVFMQLFMQAGPAAIQILNALVPAIAGIASGLVPVIAAVTKVAAAVVTWLDKTHLLIPALIALGAALTVAGGPISLIVTGVALVVGGLVHLWQTSQTFREVVTTVFADVGKVVLSFAEVFLTEMQVISNIFLSVVGAIVHGAAAAFGWVPGVGGKLKSAARAFDGFKDDVNNVFNAAHSKIEGWKRDLDNMPKKVKLEGDINDLTNKLNNAKRQLRDPHLTATRRAKIEANIAQLERQLASARSQLNAINGKTAHTYVITTYESNQIAAGFAGVHRTGRAAGGTIGAAGGGPRSGLTMVGEHGPELLRLPAGSTVHSNPDTQRMLSQGGGGDIHITLELGPSFRRVGLTPEQLADIRATVVGKGGGDVQRAFGSSR